MIEKNEVCVKYGPGATVAVDLSCPRHGCAGGEAMIPGSAIVMNDYGVRDPIPLRCKATLWTGNPCGCLLEVQRIVDIEEPICRG